VSPGRQDESETGPAGNTGGAAEPGFEPLDWREIEFRGGIEIHQQIDTRKLFCECQPAIRKDTPHERTRRKLHAVASELGEYDPAALHEAHRDRTFFYESYEDSVCLVELDEEPPHPVNRRALEVVLQTSLMLGARIVDEIQVMRKTVIDGSNTAGFQRTMLVATDGVMQTSEGDVVLQYFCLEEDAARIIETDDRSVRYRLDRLGIPLLEIVTGPVFVSPVQAGEVADRLGHIIRSLQVRRGIGSVRQDVNVSTRYSDRIEIKGVQKHRLIPLIMSNEARRQKSLWEIGRELTARCSPPGPDDLRRRTATVTDLFRTTECRALRRVIDRGGEVTAIAVPGLRGMPSRLLCPNMRLATEFKDQLLTLGIRGLLHRDEDTAARGISTAEREALEARLAAEPGDAWLIFASRPEVVPLALDKLRARIPACWKGVPWESRRAIGRGNTQYMRPLPGEARMYPETDIPPVVMTPEKVAETRAALPEILQDRITRLSERSGISAYDLWKIEDSLELLFFGIDELNLPVGLLFNFLASQVVDFRRRTGLRPTPEILSDLLESVATDRLHPEALPEALERMCAGEALETIVAALDPNKLDLEAEIAQVIAAHADLTDNPHRHQILMGALMENVRGRIDGRLAAKALAEALAGIPEQSPPRS